MNADQIRSARLALRMRHLQDDIDADGAGDPRTARTADLTAQLEQLREAHRNESAGLDNWRNRAEHLEAALKALIRACRRGGTCAFCGVALSTMHDAECPVLDAVIVLGPAFRPALKDGELSERPHPWRAYYDNYGEPGSDDLGTMLVAPDPFDDDRIFLDGLTPEAAEKVAALLARLDKAEAALLYIAEYDPGREDRWVSVAHLQGHADAALTSTDKEKQG